MKDKIVTKSEQQKTIDDNVVGGQNLSPMNYLNFFENVPYAIWIEDFTSAKKYVQNAVIKEQTTISKYLDEHPEIFGKIIPMIKIKDVNTKAVELYKGKSKQDLLENFDDIFTEKSKIDFVSLLRRILEGEKHLKVQTVNKRLNGEELHILLQITILDEDADHLSNVIVTIEDISEKVLGEKKLSTTKGLLSNTLSNIKDGLVILDQSSNYLYVNEKASELLGKSPEFLIGKNIWEEFPEKEGDLFFDNYQKALETKKPISFENFFEPWNKWFENRIVPSENEMLLFFNEITERKISENKIKTAYNIINKSSSVAILCKNEADFPAVFVSENAEQLFGYSYSDILSGNVLIRDIVHPEDAENLMFGIIEFIGLNEKTDYKPDPFRIITKGQETKWIQANIDIIKNDHGKVSHIQGIAKDITERKQAEDLFFESNHRLKTQFNHTPLASIMWDVDFKVIEWNNAAERIFGFSAEEARGKHAKDLIIPADILVDIDLIWKRLLTEKGGYRNINKNVTKDGETITCDWYNVTLKDINGKVTGVASLVDNITGRLEANQRLEASEKKYRDIFEKSIDPVFILKDGVISDCNKSALELFEFDNKEDIIGLFPSDISPEYQPNGSVSIEMANDYINDAIKKGSRRFSWYHKKSNGHVFPAEVSLTRIVENNENMSIHGVVRDITDKVKKDNLESVLYNISKAALTQTSFETFCFEVRKELNKIIDTSNFFIALLNTEKQLLTTPFLVDELDDITEFPVEGTLTGYVIKTKKPLMVNEKTHDELRAQGVVDLVGVQSKIWIGVPLISNDEAYGAIVIQSYSDENAYGIKDLQLLEFVADQISTSIQRKKVEDELQTALTKAQESDRLKSAFLANMSHEIRTPMNGIIGFSELFMKPNLNEEERKEYAEIVMKSGKQLLTIVNDILDISKIEAGLIKLSKDHVNLNVLMEDLQAFYGPIANDKKLRLSHKKGLENLSCVIEIDKAKLNQVLSNLLSNSFKFTESGSVDFGYELENEQLKFYVTDTGHGIEEELQDKIFDRFIQANLDLTKQHKGTGLGLAISKKFVELFGGEIWLTSSKKGTTVNFTIPYTKVETTNVSSVYEKKKVVHLKNMTELTILVAEDEEYNMLYMSELFSSTKFNIKEASNGREAIEIFKATPDICLVFMDIKMPYMNGYEAMKEIKEIAPNVPVIALSAFAMESDKETALKNGFDEYLSKPIDRKLMFEMIDKFTN